MFPYSSVSLAYPRSEFLPFFTACRNTTSSMFYKKNTEHDGDRRFCTRGRYRTRRLVCNASWQEVGNMIQHVNHMQRTTVNVDGRKAQFNFICAPKHTTNTQHSILDCVAGFFNVQSYAQNHKLAGVLLFSAFPFTIVKAIANSPIGSQLQESMQEYKAKAQRLKPDMEMAKIQARENSPWYGENRPKWLGPLPFKYPKHLVGEAPGDYGFDIFNLGAEPAKFDRYFNFEVLHARWAMLGALGVVIPEILDRFSGVEFSESVWWRVGYAKLQGDTLDYLGIPGLHLAGGQGILVIAVCQFLLMVGPEYARYCGIEALEPLGIFLPGDINYPGGVLFDPLGLSKDPIVFEELKVKEMKNGRLAMVAWLGFYAQAAVTKKGPLENLLSHINDPSHENILSYISSAM